MLLQRYLAIINVSSPSETSSSKDSDSTANGTFGSGKNKLISGSGRDKDAASIGTNSSATANGSTVAAGASANADTSSAGTAGRVRMETNFYVLATACLLLANKSLRARVGSTRPRRREELLRAAYGVQFRGRAVEKGTAEVVKWEGKLAAAELEVLVALRFDVHLTDPFEALDQQRGQQVGVVDDGVDVVVVVVVVAAAVAVAAVAVAVAVAVVVELVVGSWCW